MAYHLKQYDKAKEYLLEAVGCKAEPRHNATFEMLIALQVPVLVQCIYGRQAQTKVIVFYVGNISGQTVTLLKLSLYLTDDSISPQLQFP